ncbi:acetate--CoA ligase [Candidatus Gracilibacteria bacterium GN02-872]|nr:acetate--CoA ligase [Candidatus Gracilibacteria bacterium GN02-872]
MKIFPNEKLAQKAYFKNFKEVQDFYDFSIKNFEEFWEKQAHENLTFFENFTEVLDEKDYPKVSWFKNGKINICFEAVDKQAEKNPDKIAIIFVGEPGDEEKVTYKELQKKVCKSANLLKNIGVKKGDKVVFYMPQILETIYLMLACLRIGAIHSIVFGGFSAASLQDRIEDLEADFLITADGAFRKGKPYLLKNIADEALINSKHKVKKTLIVRRNFEKINISENDVIYNEEIDKQNEICDFEKIDSEDISFILYTSGSTGKPKGIIHSTTGYALWTKLTTKWVFDLHKDDIFFSTADIGWITGHSYTVYGPLLNGGTTLIYEGNPLFPKEDRIWEIIEKYKVSKFYTAPTLIRLLHKTGENLPKNFDLSSLKVLGSVGEPIDSETWDWYFETVGNKKASIADTYWQTETGGHIIAPFPFAIPMKKRSAGFPLPGICGEIVDKNGKKLGVEENGFFVISKPWPAMARGIWGDNEKFVKAYFSDIFREGKPLYFSGDGGFYDKDGYIFITGRIDDVINISGHKIGIAEVEDIVDKNENIAECALVGIPDELTGEALFGFLVLKDKKNISNTDLLQELNTSLRKEIGPIVSLKNILIISELPKTRSGKIVRRVLRNLAKGKEIEGDLSTVENKEVLGIIQEKIKNFN